MVICLFMFCFYFYEIVFGICILFGNSVGVEFYDGYFVFYLFFLGRGVILIVMVGYKVDKNVVFF